jgi:phosphoesterase RecJ-like protein
MSTLTPRFEELSSLFDGVENVVVSGHAKADGDAVGAIAAMRRHLELEGKRVTALLLEPLSPRYRFMEFADKHEVYDPTLHRGLMRDAEVFVMCDLSMPARLGALAEAVENSECKTVCIDHHPCEDEGPGEVNLLDATATATGRIVWDYIHHVEGRVDREIAESVFVSVSTDTGWFRYSNTDAAVMELAAELAEHRLDLPDMYRAIYQSNSIPMLRLLGHVTRSLNEEFGGRFVWSSIGRNLVETLGVSRLDTDPILDILRSAEHVEVVALFTENLDGTVSLSLRSRGSPDMNRVAREVGGGGHAFAAGATFKADDAVKDRRTVLAAIRRGLREA